MSALAKIIFDGTHHLSATTFAATDNRALPDRIGMPAIPQREWPQPTAASTCVLAALQRDISVRDKMKPRSGENYSCPARVAWQQRGLENSKGCRTAACADDAGTGEPVRRVVPWCRTKALVPCVNNQHRRARCATTIRCQHPFGRVDCSTTGSAIRVRAGPSRRSSKRPLPARHGTRAIQ